MKLAPLLISLATALLLGGCADQSLVTDEEYVQRKGPAPFSPDPMQHIPEVPDRPPGY